MSMTTLSELQGVAEPPVNTVAVGMETVGGFEAMQRIAKLFSSSSIVPQAYRGNLPNCFIAVDMAMRMGANPLLVMQNLYIVHGNPAWSAQFLIATFNKSGRFSAIRYEMSGEKGEDSWGCRANAIELATGEKLIGPLVTIDLAKKNGWYNKRSKEGGDFSKWQTMPEMMLRYRAAAWFVRAYAPEIAMGLQTIDEVRDTTIDIGIDAFASEDVALERIPSKLKRKARAFAAKLDAGAIDVGPEQGPVMETVKSHTPNSATFAIEQFECPILDEEGNPRLVTQDDCLECPSRQGCPKRRP